MLHIKAILLASTNRIALFERDICPASGFLCFGEATTAQGPFQICEVGWQLRGESGARQVPGSFPPFSEIIASVQLAACTSMPMYRSIGASFCWGLLIPQLKDVRRSRGAPT